MILLIMLFGIILVIRSKGFSLWEKTFWILLIIILNILGILAFLIIKEIRKRNEIVI
jgi:hypothetical protein